MPVHSAQRLSPVTRRPRSGLDIRCIDAGETLAEGTENPDAIGDQTGRVESLISRSLAASCGGYFRYIPAVRRTPAVLLAPSRVSCTFERAFSASSDLRLDLQLSRMIMPDTQRVSGKFTRQCLTRSSESLRALGTSRNCLTAQSVTELHL